MAMGYWFDSQGTLPEGRFRERMSVLNGHQDLGQEEGSIKSFRPPPPRLTSCPQRASATV